MSKVSEMIEIDGAQGEGGGQVLRTALSLAACRGVPLKLDNIRQGRKNPGLMRQHLVCVKAIAEVCNAEVTGAFLGSRAITFVPGKIEAGDYRFDIGSAGSTTLVFQTVLPALLLAGRTSRLILTGGTHNPLAPSFDFIQHAFLPVLEQTGCEFEAKLERYGFYPVGAGAWTITIKPPETFNKLSLETRGQLLKGEAQCISSRIPGHVIAREKQQLLHRLKWTDGAISTRQVESLGPGNSVIIKVTYPEITEVVESLGARGISAERVADQAVDQLRNYQSSAAPVGHYLADQLLVPLCVGAGGSFVTGPLSGHCKTNIGVIRQMLDIDISTEEIEPQRQWRITVNNSLAVNRRR